MEVLVVEDDENYRFEIEQELAVAFEAYVTFHYAKCLQEAQEILENSDTAIQLMLIDIIFPLTVKDSLTEKVDYRAGVKLLDFARDTGFSGNIVVLSSQDKSFAVDLLINSSGQCCGAKLFDLEKSESDHKYIHYCSY